MADYLGPHNLLLTWATAWRGSWDIVRQTIYKYPIYRRQSTEPIQEKHNSGQDPNNALQNNNILTHVYHQ